VGIKFLKQSELPASRSTSTSVRASRRTGSRTD